MPLDLIAFIPFAVVMTGTPGPANVVVMAAGAAFGLRRVLPLLAGVILGKQFIIWPLGLGLLEIAAAAPMVFAALKWASVGYLLWLAWRVAGLRVARGAAAGEPPGFFAGLIVHPLNPKAWAMVTAAYAGFVDPAAGAVAGAAAVALGFLAVQMLTQTLYAVAGDRLVAAIAGRPAERWVMRGLAFCVVASVSYVLAEGA